METPIVGDFTGERVAEGAAEWIWAHHLRRYEFACANVEGKAVLDLGCGIGYGTEMLSRRGGAISVLGLDIFSKAIDEARAAADDHGVDFAVADLDDSEALDPYRSMFDIAVCFEVIEHVRRPRVLLENVATTLRDDGLLIISTPNRRLNSPWRGPLDDPLNEFHVREFLPREFERLVKRSFVVQQRLGQCRVNRPAAWLFRDRIHRELEERFSRDGGGIVRRVAPWQETHTVVLVAKKRSRPSWDAVLRRKARSVLWRLSNGGRAH